MSLILAATLVCLGGAGGFSAGLLGFGGGVLMFPLLYYVPPLIGSAALDAKTVAAIVVSQVFFATLTGSIAHFRSGRVQGRMALTAGALSAISAFTGSVVSSRASEAFLLVLFGIVTLMVVLIMLLPAPSKSAEETAVGDVIVPQLPLLFFSLCAGLVIGFLGAGNFMFVPLMVYLLRVPTRIAIGSSLIIAVMNTAGGFIGKLVTGQIPLLSATLVVAGATLGALAGERAHGHVSSLVLRRIYAGMVALIALRVWLTILGVDQ